MLLDDTATILAHADFFDICNEEQRRMLAFASERRRFSAGEVIIEPSKVPEGAFVLVNGTIASRPSEADSGQAYETSAQGAVIGTMALMLAKPRPVTVTAISDADTIFVARPSFLKLVQQNPDLAERVAARIRRELGSYIGAIERMRSRMGRD
jgi:CRP-like cAMP-binding protein